MKNVIATRIDTGAPVSFLLEPRGICQAYDFDGQEFTAYTDYVVVDNFEFYIQLDAGVVDFHPDPEAFRLKEIAFACESKGYRVEFV